MKFRVAILLSVLSVMVVGTLMAADATESKVDWAKIKCIVSGKPAKEEAKVDYKGGHVYFCCPGCPGAFEKDAKKFASKANHQLVATHQAKQEKCPMSGKDLNPETKVTIGDVDVTFCCKNCKAAAEGKKGDEQIDLVFGDKAFEKAFKMVDKEKK